MTIFYLYRYLRASGVERKLALRKAWKLRK
jgi:hypothetical protein